MNQTLPPIIQTKELLKLRSSENLVVIDAGSGKSTQNRYNEKHLEGALYVDLDDQLAAIGDDPAKGGRHPLPTAEQFSKTLTGLGISRQSHVAIYDDKNGANSAARFWWMLKAIDHEKVQVLDGGLQEAEKNGFPMSSRQETPKKVQPYPIAHWQLPQADMNEVERVSQNKNYRVIDVREADRYKGLTEPIDLIAGHIPGAINVPFKTNLSDDGLFKSPAELKKKYEQVLGDVKSDHVIVHCGSGVTACHTLLAIAHARMEIPKLYVGSWSEWSRNDKPIWTDKVSK